MKLYSYWRSSCSWRVRIALHYKNIEHTTAPVHLLRQGGEQHQAAYKACNPSAYVPCLQLPYADQTATLGESVAILEFLEELHPQPALLPQDRLLRARARQLAQMVSSGIQPLHNLRTMQRLEQGGIDKDAWAHQWLQEGLLALEEQTRKTAGRYMLQDQISIADACLVPQLYAARRYNVDVAPFKTLARVEQALQTHPAFIRAHADNQPDAPKS